MGLIIIYIYAFLCVLGLACGQVLFKLSAVELNQSDTFFTFKALSYFLIAVVLYGITSIGWVFLLKKIEIGRIYPVMAFAFVLVPLGSYIFLGERFHPQYYVGVVIIILGIIIAVKA